MDSEVKPMAKKTRHVFRTVVVIASVFLLGGALYVICDRKQVTSTINQVLESLNSRRSLSKANTIDELAYTSSHLPEPSEPSQFEHAAVAADHAACSKIGADILEKKGGHAVDAAIATALCVGVVNPHSAGIGGGGFMVIFDKKKNKSSAIDFREVAPKSLMATTQEDMQKILALYKQRERTKMVPSEGLLVGVPGELRGFEMAWKKYGRLNWTDLFAPAAKLARDGFKVHPHLAAAISKNSMNISTSLGLRDIFQKNGKFLELGDILRRPVYAKTLEEIGESGSADIFYTGKYASTIVREINDKGGIMKLDDLMEYEARNVTPLFTNLGDLKILAAPPPAGCAVLINILKILKEFNFRREDLRNSPARTYHRIVEAFKFAYGKLTYLGDPKFSKKSAEIVKKMMDDQESRNIFNRIDDSAHPVEYYGPVSYHIDVTDGTTHLSVVDEEGNAVSLTSSINKYFGAKIRSRDLGVIYNDQLFDAMNPWVNEYSLEPDSLMPQKRPMSLSCPTIMLGNKGNVRMVIGAAGGRYIASALAQVIMNYYWFGDNLKDAVSRPRLHAQLFPNMVLVEDNFSTRIAADLRSKYKHCYITNDTALFTGTPKQIMGVVQVIVRKKNGELLALADYRKGGIVAGYR